MRYLPRIRGVKLGLYDENGFAPSLPKGIKVRFDTVNVPASFQFFDGKTGVDKNVISCLYLIEQTQIYFPCDPVKDSSAAVAGKKFFHTHWPGDTHKYFFP